MVEANLENEGQKHHDDLIDITHILRECAATLSWKEPFFCNETSFTLLDSMAALELMDPKMDCCEIPANLVGPGSADIMVPPRPIPTGLDDIVSNLPWDNLTLYQTAVIALEGLSRLEAFLSGASMPESTFTCMYAHSQVLADMKTRLDNTSTLTEQFGQLMNTSPTKTRAPPTTPQLVLYATTLSLVHISDVVRSIVVHADIYEEEDFSITMFGLQVFRDAEDKEPNSAYSAITNCLSKLRGNESIEAKILSHILQFQFAFLKVCTTMAKLSSASVRATCEQVQKTVKAGVAELTALKDIQHLLQLDTDETKLLLKCSYDPFVYRPLVGSSPTRKLVYKQPAESIDILIKVLSEVSSTSCRILLEGSTLPQIRRLLQTISVSSINILSRSLIVLNLYFDDRLLGQYALIQLIGQDIQQTSATLDVLLETTNGVAFLHRLAKPIYDTLKLLVLNRNRQRTYLEAIMFPEWTALQREAHTVDVAHRQEQAIGANMSPFFLQYVLCITVDLMDHFVALGVELGLFQGHHDLAVAYWYRDFLLSTLLSTMTHMRQVKALVTGKSDTIENGIHGLTLELNTEDEEADFAFMMIGLKRNMCRGLVRFIAALNQAGVVKNDFYEFTSHEKRFRKRFDHFASIPQPPILTYEDFRQGSDFSKVSSKDLLASAEDCFKQCKGVLDGLSAALENLSEDVDKRKADLRKLAKTIVGNSVFLMKLTQMIAVGTTPDAVKIVFDFELTQFCTIKID